jgi:uncharacterized protein YkwD
VAAALVAVAVALLLTAGASAATRHRHRHHAEARCAGAHRRIAASTASALKAAVVCLINQQRSGRGLPALRANTDLDHSAQRWTRVLVTHHEFTHGSNFASRITAAGFHWSQAGENIATGYPTPSSVVRGWMGSTGHCENILDPSYRAVGTGVSPRAAVPTAPGTWTQDFALRLGQRPASRDTGPAAGCPYH